MFAKKKEIEKELLKIKNEVIECRKCSLYKTRKFPVIGEGNHQAKIVFVGEAPGRRENETGRPFCGQAGHILDELLNSIHLRREDIYICNLLKCRPPFNRDPLSEEIKACSPYVLRQIKIINPKIICTLGNFASKFFLEEFGLSDKVEGISKLHGKIFSPDGKKFKIIPLYHPAVAVYNDNMKRTLEKDFKILEKLIKKPNSK